MFFAKKVTSKGGFSVFFLDICHTNDKLPTFKINFKDEKSTIWRICLTPFMMKVRMTTSIFLTVLISGIR